MPRIRFVIAAALAVLAASPVLAQPNLQQTYEILGVTVEGVEDESAETFIIQVADLRPGTRVALPDDEAFAIAVRNLYNRAQTADAEILVDRVTGTGVFLTIRVEQQPRLGGVTLEGLGRSERDDVTDQLPLVRGRRVRTGDVEQSRLLVQEYLREKGYRLATVSASQEIVDVPGDQRLAITLTADKGERVEVQDVVFVGNEAFPERTLRRRLKNTPEDRWWRFWSSSTYTQSGGEEDQESLIRFYNDRGYYGARVMRDSVYMREVEGEEPELVVEVEVDEGPLYHVRDVVFEGN
ncbi:MAG: POTRA domain-containing protein, partial [Bacteroidota bacterium]